MEFQKPFKDKITIYSKSGCHNCIKTKQFLKSKNILFDVIDCDEYLLEDRDGFLTFISENAKKEYKSFPMVFDGKIFIGGYNETIDYIDKLLSFDINF